MYTNKVFEIDNKLGLIKTEVMPKLICRIAGIFNRWRLFHGFCAVYGVIPWDKFESLYNKEDTSKKCDVYEHEF